MTEVSSLIIKATIIKLQTQLSLAGFTLVETTRYLSSANLYLTRVYDSSCVSLFSDGCGDSKDEALKEALLEFCKNTADHYFWRSCYLGRKAAALKPLHRTDEKWFSRKRNGSWPDGVLNSELQDFYDPDFELNASQLIDVNSSNFERGICSIPFKKFEELISDNVEPTYFPVNVLDNIYANNGSAIASTLEGARLKALSLIIARYMQLHVIANDLSLPEVPTTTLNHYPKIKEKLDAINDSALNVVIKDASLDGRFPVICGILFDENKCVSLHFSSNPSFESSVNSAIVGLMRNYAIEDYEHVVELGFDLDEISSPYNLEQHFYGNKGLISWHFLSDQPDHHFVDWNTGTSDINEQFKHLTQLIIENGHEIYLSETNVFDMHHCQIIIPGFSEIFPQDKLVWENNNVGITIRSQLLKQHKSIDEYEELILTLENLNHEDDFLVSELIALPADENSTFTDLTIVELITLLAFKTQDNERIQEGCEWLCHYKKIQPRRLNAYQCINALLQLDGMTHYSVALKKLFSQDVVNDALALLDGEDVFPLESEWNTHKILADKFIQFNEYKSGLF